MLPKSCDEQISAGSPSTRAENEINQCRGAQAQEALRLFVTRQGHENDARISALLAALNEKNGDRPAPAPTPSYDGSAKSLAYAIYPVLIHGTFRLNIPCQWIARDNDLIDLTEPPGGGGNDENAPHIACADPDFALPPDVVAYYRAVDALGETSDVCGTIAADYGASELMARDILQFAPAYDGQHMKGEQPKQLLEVWQLASVWNYRTAQDVRARYEQAKVALSRYYQRKFGEDPVVADKNAVWHLSQIGGVWSNLPMPKDDFRYAVLRDLPLAEVKKTFASLRNDGFAGLNDSTPFPHERDLRYRWNDFKANAGLPEPPLLISILRPEVIGFLIENHEPVDETNRFGKTALMTAAQFDQTDAVRLLLKAGARVNAASAKPDTILDNAGDSTCTARRVRIEHGQRTALMYAAENASLELIRLLRQAGADPCLKDSKGLTAWDYLDGRAPSGRRNASITTPPDKQSAQRLLTCPSHS